MTKPLIVTLAIILQFSIAAFSFIILGTLLSGIIQSELPATGIYILLFFTVLLTVHFLIKVQKNEVRDLNNKLKDSRNETKILQQEFNQSLEAKVYELQIANGKLNREVAERIQAEEEIRELQKQQSLILNSAGEGILGLDNKGKVIFMNQAACLMLGWEEGELIGASHHEMIHHTHADGTPHREEDCLIYMAYRDGQVHFNTEDVFWCKNGTSFPVEYVSTPIRDRGTLTGAVVVFRDMNTYE